MKTVFSMPIPFPMNNRSPSAGGANLPHVKKYILYADETYETANFFLSVDTF